MSRNLCIALVALFILGPAGIAGAEEGTLPCPMGTQHWDPKTVMCLPRQPRNWVGCTGLAGSGEGGRWSETGISCDKPAPQTPAEYVDTTEVPHPKPAPEAKRVIDLFGGVLFVCVPDSKVEWTPAVCGKIEAEWKRQANAANLTSAIYDPGSDDAAKQKKADGVGIAPGAAVEWRMWFTGRQSGGVELENQMTGVLEMLPGIWGRRAIFIGGGFDMRADEAKPSAAVDAASQAIEANFKFLLGPR
jgi:hypothetical protein